MKAISLWQPWSSLIALGYKKIETRSWGTEYRGPIAIHAAKRFDLDQAALSGQWPFFECLKDLGDGPVDQLLPKGAVVAIAELYDCKRMTRELIDYIRQNGGYEIRFGNYSVGRYAWMLRNVQPLVEPIPARGMQGLFNWEPPEGLDLEVVA
jgi:hypothetical protein